MLCCCSIAFQDNDHVDRPNDNEMGMADYIVASGDWVRDYYLAEDENEEPDLDPQQVRICFQKTVPG